MFYAPSKNLHLGTPPSSPQGPGTLVRVHAPLEPLKITQTFILNKLISYPTDFGCLEDYRADILRKINQNPEVFKFDMYEVVEEIQTKCCTAAAYLLKSQLLEAYEIMMKLRYELLAYSKIDYFISKKEFRQKCIQCETFLENIEAQVDRLFFNF